MRETLTPASHSEGTIPNLGADLRLAGPVWIAWRHAGKKLSGGWHRAKVLSDAITAARSQAGAEEADTLELCLTGNYIDVPPNEFAKYFSNNARGRFGLEVSTQGTVVHRVPATETIATNRRFQVEASRVVEASKRPSSEVLPQLTFRRFDCQSILIDLKTGGVNRLHRGGQLVSPEQIGPEMLGQTIEGLCGWMRKNLHPDGRMTYKYWPSRGAESEADNTIRQFMATVALGRIAARSGTPEDAEAARRNLRRNLATYYSEIDGRGTILHDGKGKLGAMALAALAVLEFRNTGLIEGTAHEAEFTGLLKGIDSLWQADGSFRTFLVPQDRNDNQNFYPGEALLFWAALHRHTKDPSLAERCMASFRYYRAWHLAQPNPAFIPWHTQAYVMLHEDLGHAELADFVFDRNDWLLAMQQWGGDLAPDLWGRFYDPGHPEYGPPHASSTGVYLEGLADAWRLAVRLGESARAGLYARAIRRGLRSIRQLQFRDPAIDAFYVRRKSAVMGGLRTEVYNNEIRVDNVQHCLMALLKIEGDAGFPWQDDAPLSAQPAPPAQSTQPLWSAQELESVTGGTWLVSPGKTWAPRALSYDVTGNMRGHICVLPHPQSWGKDRRDPTEDIPRLARQGAAAILVQPAHLQALEASGTALPHDVPVLRVDSTWSALRQLAEASRARFSGKVFAVTGTVGKTTTREMIRHLVDAQGGATASKANNNNISGVFRSLAYMPRDNAGAAIEMGFGKPLDGIGISTTVARPDVALLTTIDVAHLDAFTPEMLAQTDGRELLCRHKAQIFSGLVPGGAAVINADIPEYPLVRALALQHTDRVFGFGRAQEATARLLNIEVGPASSRITCSIFGRTYSLTVPLPGAHMAHNALGALLAVSAAGFDLDQAIGDIEAFSAVKGRARHLEVTLPSGGSATVIDDSFNATLASMRSTLDLLDLVSPGPGGRRIAVLGEIGHIGPQEDAEHIRLGSYIQQKQTDLVFTWGPLMRGLYESLPPQMQGHHEDESLDALYEALQANLKDGDVLTVKSGRGVNGLGDVGFRRIVQRLSD